MLPGVYADAGMLPIRVDTWQHSPELELLEEDDELLDDELLDEDEDDELDELLDDEEDELEELLDEDELEDELDDPVHSMYSSTF